MSSSASGSQSRFVLPSKRGHPGEGNPEVVLITSSFSDGPIGQAIYAVTLPKYDGDGPILRPHRVQNSRDLYPIVEIPSNMLDSSLSCVQLKSRLYYLGRESLAEDDTLMRNYSTNVYFIELSDLYAYASAAVADAHVCPPLLPPVSSLIKQGIPMKKGKPRCYAFVVEEKLYAIGYSACPAGMGMGLDQFEVFDPETSEWSTLPPPPRYRYTVCSHAVVGDKLIMATMSPQSVYIPSYFDMVSKEWVDYHPKRIFYSVIPAVFVGDSLYFHSGYQISSFGPIAAGGDLSSLFDSLSMASSELSEAISVDMDYSSKLIHLGNNTFLYLMGVNLHDPEYPDDPDASDSEKDLVKVVMFEVTGERLIQGKNRIFQTKLLQSLDYVRRSKSGADFDASMITGCFPNSVIAEWIAS